MMLFSTKSEQIVKKRIDEGLMLGGIKLQNAESFKYLGSTMDTNCNCTADIRVRTATASIVLSDIDIV